MDGSFDRFEKAPEGCGGAVTEYRSLSAGEHSGHPAPVPAQAAVSHGVDAAVDAMEAPLLDATGDAVLAHPPLAELGNRDYSVLSGRDSCHG